MNETIKVLIPAAGFGTRVGSPAAKELFLRADTKKPLIDWTLNQISNFDFYATIIIRRDKITLIDHLKSHPFYLKNFNLCTIDGSTDWQDTILQSQPYWGEFNIVALPDTDWQPTNILNTLATFYIQNKSVKTVVALHSVTDCQNWGIIYSDILKTDQFTSESTDSFFWCEKPKIKHNKLASLKKLGAWGLFGFQRSYGVELLNQLIDSQKTKNPFRINTNLKIAYLDCFTDLTR